MQLQRKPLAILAATLLAAGGANAAITSGANGNGSLLFVAADASSTMGLTVDLGYLIADVIPLTSTIGFANAGTTIVWDFKTNTRTVNGVSSSAGFGWSGQFDAFASSVNAGSVKWGVVGGDSAASGPAAAIIPGRNYVGTGNLTDVMSAGAVNNATGRINSFSATSNTLGTHGSFAHGANVATDGGAYLYSSTSIGANFSGFGWDYMVDNGASSTFQVAQASQADPFVFQIGADLNGSQATLAERAAFDNMPSANPGQFTFDVGTGTLTWSVASVSAVPEPETYAMLLAGLAAVAGFARRRKASSKA